MRAIAGASAYSAKFRRALREASQASHSQNSIKDTRLGDFPCYRATTSLYWYIYEKYLMPLGFSEFLTATFHLPPRATSAQQGRGHMGTSHAPAMFQKDIIAFCLLMSP